MTSRKIFGYIFIVIAVLLTLAFLGQLPKFPGTIVGIFRIFYGQVDSYQVGHTIGTFVYWLFHIGLTILLWNIGIRWTKKQIKDNK